MHATIVYFPNLLETERGKVEFEIDCLEDMFLEEVKKLLRDELETKDDFLFFKSKRKYD